MQTYGLVRIYDAKLKNFDARSARLDYALCLAWFGVLYWRTDGAAGVLSHYYRAGGRLPPELIRAGVWSWAIGTVIITGLYVRHMIQRYPSRSSAKLAQTVSAGHVFFLLSVCLRIHLE